MNGAGMRGMMRAVDPMQGFEFCYPDAPHQVNPNGFPGWPQTGLTWFRALSSEDVQDFAQYLMGEIDRLCGGSVDVLLGYSQGGIASSALLGSHWKNDQRFANLKAVVMMNTYAVSYFNRASPHLKSLHAFSLQDTIIQPDSSRSFAGKFTRPTKVEHSDGTHHQPMVQKVVTAIHTFLNDLRA